VSSSSSACAYPDEYLLGYQVGHDSQAQTVIEPEPAPMAKLAVVQEPKLVCQSNDDFCEPGCEYVDMQCIDDNKRTITKAVAITIMAVKTEKIKHIVTYLIHLIHVMTVRITGKPLDCQPVLMVPMKKTGEIVTGIATIKKKNQTVMM